MRHAFPRKILSGGLVLAALALLPYLPVVRAERLPVRLYTSADGLGSSATFNLVRDSRGFIWICSRDGLIRFDGYRFLTYRIGNEDADPAVYDLLPTRNGVYWVNLNSGTDYRFVAKDDARLLEPLPQGSAKNTSRIPLSAEPVTHNLLPLLEDRAGYYWTSDIKGLYRMREVDGQMVSQLIELKGPEIPPGGLTSVVFHEGRDGSLWIATNLGLVRRLPDGKMIYFTLRPQDMSNPIIWLAADDEGRIWMARPEGLLVLKVEPLAELTGVSDFTARKVVIRKGVVSRDGQAQLPEHGGEAAVFTFPDILRRERARNLLQENTPKPAIHALLAASDGKIWITGSRGLVVFDGKRFQHFTSQQGLGPNDLTSIVEDNEGHLWIASYSGLHKLNPKGLTTFDQTDGLRQTRVLSIYEDRNGELNVVTDDWNISRMHNGVLKTARPRLPVEAAATWHSNQAFLDSRGDWWIITRQKLYRYSGISRIEELGSRNPTAVYTSRDGLISDGSFRVFEDSKGDIWISTYPQSKNLGLTRWQRATGKFQTFDTQADIPQAACVSAFAEDKAGNLWFGFLNGGMARYKDGRFRAFNLNDGVPRGMITSLFVDRRERLWIASSQNGLSRLDSPDSEPLVFRNYTIDDGLTSNNIRCISEDLFGNIYVGTVRGVNRLSPETGQITYYGITDGLAADFVSVAYRDRSGAMWFGTFNGLSKLIPEPDLPSPPPPIFISGLRIAGEDYAVSPLGQNAVSVSEQSANRNNLQIDFLSIGTGGNASTRYQYKLEGADADWGPLTAERSVTFANLSPGSYGFFVRAVNAEGIASLQPATVSFTILRPIWQRWWFVTLMALFLTLLAYAAYRYRLARLLELERVRTRIATDLHDDIGASLSRMAILSEVVKQQTGNGNHQSGKMLTEIAESARGLVDSMSDIVWSIDPRKDDLANVAMRVRQFASDVLESQGISWKLEVPPEASRLKLAPEHRRHIYLICKEALNNIARHADCDSVTLKLTLLHDHLQIAISDNGRGFDANSLAENLATNRGGNGLKNMQARAMEAGGTFEIQASPGNGTQLFASLPLKESPARKTWKLGA